MQGEQIREFPREEYERRLELVQREMKQLKLDALFIADERNHRYLTGHYSEMVYNKARPSFSWVPVDGEPIVITNEPEAPWAQEASWCQEVIPYSDLTMGAVSITDGVRILGFEDAIRQAIIDGAGMLGVADHSRIGIAQDSWHRFDLPVRHLSDLRVAFPSAEWIDAAGILWSSRIVKSELEVEYIGDAVDALDSGIAAVIASLRPGLTENEVARRFRAEMLLAGADHVGYTNVSDVRSSTVLTTPSERSIPARSIVFMDGGAFVHGYASDHNRLVSVGAPTDDEKYAYEVLVNALDAARLKAKPGNTAGDVAQASHDVFRDAGADPRFLIGRAGHGTGLEQPEPPSVHPADETVLKPGMVLSLEPNMRFGDAGFLIAEDMVVIREDGAELLSSHPMPPELPVIG